MGLCGTTHGELGNHWEEQLGGSSRPPRGSRSHPMGYKRHWKPEPIVSQGSVVPMTQMIIFQAFKLGQQALFVQRAPRGGHAKKSRLTGMFDQVILLAGF